MLVDEFLNNFILINRWYLFRLLILILLQDNSQLDLFVLTLLGKLLTYLRLVIAIQSLYIPKVSIHFITALALICNQPFLFAKINWGSRPLLYIFLLRVNFFEIWILIFLLYFVFVIYLLHIFLWIILKHLYVWFYIEF